MTNAISRSCIKRWAIRSFCHLRDKGGTATKAVSLQKLLQHFHRGLHTGTLPAEPSIPVWGDSIITLVVQRIRCKTQAANQSPQSGKSREHADWCLALLQIIAYLGHHFPHHALQQLRQHFAVDTRRYDGCFGIRGGETLSENLLTVGLDI